MLDKLQHGHRGLMGDSFKIELQGAEELKMALDKVSQMLDTYMQQAGKEAASKEILPTEGIQTYPSETEANMPPTPYYIRGTGMQVSYSRNLNNSERLGTRWNVTGVPYGVNVSNAASYSGYVHGRETQAEAMGRIGWRKLWDVAEEKRAAITRIFQLWFEKLMHDSGLK
jgi:hypothetical protein